MPPTTFAPANLQWVGIAPEVTYGTAIATPSLWVPVDSPTWKPTIASLLDTNLRGSMGAEYEQLLGLRFDTISFKTKFYLDSCFYFLRSLLGQTDVVTGSSDPWTHTTSLQNTTNNGQPASSTVFWTDAAGKTWQMAGAQALSVKITLKQDALAEMEVTYIGLPATAINPPTNTPTTAKPMPSWNTVITVGGTAYTKYSEITLEYKRGTEMIPTITGTQSPFAIFGGPVSIGGSFVGVYQGSTDNDLAGWLTNTQPALVVKTNPAGDAVHYLQMTLSKVAYDDVAVSGTNKWMEVKSTIKGLSNATDAVGGLFSPSKVILLSPVSTAI